MDTHALTVCKTFLERSPTEMKERLFALLPASDRETLLELAIPRPLSGELLERDFLEEIHPSWIAPLLRNLSDGDLRLFLAVLSDSQQKELEKELGFGNHLPILSSFTKKTLRTLLWNVLTEKQTFTPLAFLPDSPFNSLLDLSRQTLKQLVLFLGLHDLSFEMRQIIATAVLKKIFSALGEKEGAYLNSLLLHREPLVFQRLFLQTWDGSKEHLRKLIQERGLHRLAHALYSQDKSLIWYLTRKLSMHMGTGLLKYDDKPTHTRAEAILLTQIQKILKTLTPGEST